MCYVLWFRSNALTLVLPCVMMSMVWIYFGTMLGLCGPWSISFLFRNYQESSAGITSAFASLGFFLIQALMSFYFVRCLPSTAESFTKVSRDLAILSKRNNLIKSIVVFINNSFAGKDLVKEVPGIMSGSNSFQYWWTTIVLAMSTIMFAFSMSYLLSYIEWTVPCMLEYWNFSPTSMAIWSTLGPVGIFCCVAFSWFSPHSMALYIFFKQSCHEVHNSLKDWQSVLGTVISHH